MLSRIKQTSNGVKINTDSKKIEEVLTRRVVEILPGKKELTALMKKRRIRLYLGVDPTGTNLHLGHTVALRKLQEFAGLGHEAILVIGTGTVLTGDPSLRERTRPKITEEEIKKNIKTWKRQVEKVIDLSKIEIKCNGDWLLKLGLKGIIDIASHISAIRLFQRGMFQQRLKKGETVWVHETLYPLLQGYDSVVLDVDLEIGGTDQTFNMLIGRELLKKMRNKEKFVMSLQMALGTNGRPMSKTSGNCIWIKDPPREMFGKIMSISDQLIIPYFELFTDIDSRLIAKLRKELKTKKINPSLLKRKLGSEIVKKYHSEKAAQKAEQEFNRIFKEKAPPSKVPQVLIKEKILNILGLLVKTKLISSKSEAKRLVLQKGVKIGGRVIDDWKQEIQIKDGQIVQIGKRKFVRINRPSLEC